MKINEQTPGIIINNLTKKYGDFVAVNNISLRVDPGKIFGFLGPNGAGKTTTIKILAGLLKQDIGEIIINGYDISTHPEKCKFSTGYIPDRPFLYEKLTGIEFLKFIASLYSLSIESFEKNSNHLMGLFDLYEWKDHLIESYSHGMRQKLIMTSVFMLNSPMIIVDEPMVGLDPKSAKIVKELFKKHSINGGSIFLSTHSLEIAEELCDEIAIILNGEIRIIGDMESLRKEASLHNSDLEEVFLQLTDTEDLSKVISALKDMDL
ncbi:MAG: ABC transporter ATP-binding protein [Candidatus Neomarinimicrobiota bacterium]|nr:ABC transporter ATP-binding protein [Candidatus Neomarinimicrobiota bacterium]